MDRAQLRHRIDRAWLDFTRSYAGLGDSQLLEPRVTGEWSVRDIIVHVTMWEEEALTHLPVIMEGGRPPRYSVTFGGIDAFNAMMTERNAGLTLAEVRARQLNTHDQLLAFIDTVPESQFREETRFRRRLRWDTYGHYPRHAAAILAWRELRSVK